MKEKTWLTTRQAAYLLKVSIRTVQTWVDTGKIKAIVTPGGHRRIAYSEFAKKLKELSPLKYDVIPPSSLNSDKASNFLRVLIVEDDYVILRLCEMKFAQFKIPHELFLATNAFQGLVMVGKHQPDVILTDLNMPGFDGIQMLNEILKVPDMNNTKIVVVTGLEADEIDKMGVIPDGVMVLPKPIPFNTIETILLQKLSQLLNRE